MWTAEIVLQVTITLVGILTAVAIVMQWVFSKRKGNKLYVGNPLNGDPLFRVEDTEAHPNTLTQEYLDQWCRKQQEACRQQVAQTHDDNMHLALNGWRASTDLRLTNAEKQIDQLIKMHERIDQIYSLLAALKRRGD